VRKCGEGGSEANSPESGSGEIAEIAEGVVGEFRSEYPGLAKMPVAERDGVKVRKAYAEIEYEEWCENQPDMPEFEVKNPARGERVSDISAMSWAGVIREFVERHIRTDRTTINLQKGKPWGPEYDEFSFSAENRWMESAQKRYYGECHGWLRELVGGERPSGGEVEGCYENPRIAFLTRSASSVPNGERVGPVDHAVRVRDSWREVYQRLRYELSELGFESDEWQFWRVTEPHTGKRGTKGLNEAYMHEHIILVVDGEITKADLRPVMGKHVEATEWAGREAHDLDIEDWESAPSAGECECDSGCSDCIGSVSVRDPDEIEDLAAYIADYGAIEPVGLLERSPAFIGYAAMMTAANIRTISRSDPAKWAATADRCKQRCESGKAEQEVEHGERVVRSKKGVNTVECAKCGSPHGIDQDRTLADHRTGTVAADGGVEVPDRVEELRERWPSADAGAVVGELPKRHKQREAIRECLETDMSLGEFWARHDPDVQPPDDVEQLVSEVEHPTYDPSEVVGFDNRVPEWRVKSITVDGEEKSAGGGCGVEMVEVTNTRCRLVEELGIESSQDYRCVCGVGARGATIVSHLGSHGIEEPEIAQELIVEEGVG
jgi:hypothetical protein